MRSQVVLTILSLALMMSVGLTLSGCGCESNPFAECEEEEQEAKHCPGVNMTKCQDTLDETAFWKSSVKVNDSEVSFWNVFYRFKADGTYDMFAFLDVLSKSYGEKRSGTFTYADKILTLNKTESSCSDGQVSVLNEYDQASLALEHLRHEDTLSTMYVSLPIPTQESEATESGSIIEAAVSALASAIAALVNALFTSEFWTSVFSGLVETSTSVQSQLSSLETSTTYGCFSESGLKAFFVGS